MARPLDCLLVPPYAFIWPLILLALVVFTAFIATSLPSTTAWASNSFPYSLFLPAPLARS